MLRFDRPRLRETDSPSPVEFYTPGETGEVLGLNRKGLREAAKDGLLLALRLRWPAEVLYLKSEQNRRQGGDYRFPKSYVDAVVDQVGKNSNPEALRRFALSSKDRVDGIRADFRDSIYGAAQNASRNGYLSAITAAELLGVERRTITRAPRVYNSQQRGVHVNTLSRLADWSHLLLNKGDDGLDFRTPTTTARRKRSPSFFDKILEQDSHKQITALSKTELQDRLPFQMDDVEKMVKDGLFLSRQLRLDAPTRGWHERPSALRFSTAYLDHLSEHLERAGGKLLSSPEAVKDFAQQSAGSGLVDGITDRYESQVRRLTDRDGYLTIKDTAYLLGVKPARLTETDSALNRTLCDHKDRVDAGNFLRRLVWDHESLRKPKSSEHEQRRSRPTM